MSNLTKTNLAIAIILLFWLISSNVTKNDSTFSGCNILSKTLAEININHLQDKVSEASSKKEEKRLLFTGEISAYTAGVESTGKSPGHPAYGITASGEMVRDGIVAADTSILPFGTRIHIEGLGVFVVKDTGGYIKGNRIDVYMESYSAAIKFGRQERKVYVYL